MSTKSVIAGIDKAVENFSKQNRMLNEPMTKGRAYMFVMQHRLNTRQRNSVLKLRVATNTPVWDVKMDILEACVEELVSDVEHGDGRPHWKVLEDSGCRLRYEARPDLQGEAAAVHPPGVARMGRPDEQPALAARIDGEYLRRAREYSRATARAGSGKRDGSGTRTVAGASCSV